MDMRLMQLIQAAADPIQRRAMAEKLADIMEPPSAMPQASPMTQPPPSMAMPAAPMPSPVTGKASSGLNARPKDFDTTTLSGDTTGTTPVGPAQSMHFKGAKIGHAKEKKPRAPGPVNPKSPAGLPGPSAFQPKRGAPVKGAIAKKPPIRQNVFAGLK